MGSPPLHLLYTPRASMICRNLAFLPFLFIAYYIAVSNLLLGKCLARAPTVHTPTKLPSNGGVLGLQHRDFSVELSPTLLPEARLESAVRRSNARKERIEGMLRKVKESKLYRDGGRRGDAGASKAEGASSGSKARQGGVLERAEEAKRGGVSYAPTGSASGDYSLEMEKGDGGYLTSVYIGTPPRKARLILDTGSDLVWQQCKPCEACFVQADEPVFDPSLSSTFEKSSCSDKLCQALLPTACLHHNASCQYTYMYGDTSYTSGELAYDTLTLLDALGQTRLKISGFAFGCGYASRGASFVGSDGILGMGQGPISLASQLSSNSFSYCLSSFNTHHLSPLFLGDYATTVLHVDDNSPIQVTPILRNSFMPTFYYLNFIGISLDGVRLDISPKTFSLKANGSGGMIIDSGTTITYLQEHGYRVVLNAIRSKITNPLEAPRPMFGLDLCFLSLNESTLPTLTFHFDQANMDVPPSNLFVEVAGIYCFALGGSHDISILGNMQQQNYQMLYDLNEQKLSFMRTPCDQILT